ncbi:MAG TPA: hypothetical protein VGI39_23295 [Polyangiaceae bacterium]|jgi:MYXO-CTERM domain-containing protein
MREFAGFWLGFVALLVLLLSSSERPAHAAPDYADAGAYSVTTTALDGGVAGAVAVDLVVPDSPGPFPLLVASHGWSASAAQQVGWAQHFASWGFVVAVPSFPNPLTPDAQVDRGIIASLVALCTDPTADTPAHGKVDPSRIGLEGHSAGGLASVLAASTVGPGAVVLFDPVDANDAGKSAYSTLCVPTLTLFADPSSCNNQEEWSSFAALTTSPAQSFHVVGSTHCDGENVDRGALCGIVCGGAASPTRQASYARYATAFFLAHLQGDAVAAAILSPWAIAGDPALADAQAPSGSCTPDGGGALGATPDAGEGDGGASTGSSGEPGSGGSDGPMDAGAGGGLGGAAGSGSGGDSSAAPPAAGGSNGCGCSLAGSGGAAAPVVPLALALVLARRRNKARQARG